jgi:hypothetical protein
MLGQGVGFVTGICDLSLAFYLYLIALLILQLDNAVESSSALVIKASFKAPLILRNELGSQRSLAHVDTHYSLNHADRPSSR